MGSVEAKAPERGRRKLSKAQLRELVEEATVVDLTDAEEIVAVCRREGIRQRISVLYLPLPKPPPEGWERIEAFRHWARGGP